MILVSIRAFAIQRIIPRRVPLVQAEKKEVLVSPRDNCCDVPAFVSLTNFILILTPVALQRSCGRTGLTGIRISTLSTFIHPGCGVCRETCAKFYGIDCRSFLSERNTLRYRSCSSSGEYRVSVCVCTSSVYVLAHATVTRFVTGIDTSVRDLTKFQYCRYWRCRVLKEFKILLTVCVPRAGYMLQRMYVYVHVLSTHGCMHTKLNFCIIYFIPIRKAFIVQQNCTEFDHFLKWNRFYVWSFKDIMYRWWCIALFDFISWKIDIWM